MIVDREWLTAADVAAVLQVSEQTVRRRIKDGSIAALKFGHKCVRVSRAEIQRIVDAGGFELRR